MPSFSRRYWPVIPIAAVLIVASFLEWQHAHGPRQPTYAAAPKNPAAKPSQPLETYHCRIREFIDGESAWQEDYDPWVVKDGKIILPYHGDLVPTPLKTFSVVKDDANQVVGMNYFPNPLKERTNIEILMIDKNTAKVVWIKSFPDGSFIEHLAGSCAKP